MSSNNGNPIHNGRLFIPQLPYDINGNVHTYDNYEFHKDIIIEGNALINNNLQIYGNLFVDGCATEVNNIITDDLIVTLGGNNINNNYYRGIKLGYSNGNGFFGYNPQTSQYELYNNINSNSFTNGTFNNNITIGNLKSNLVGDVTGNLNGDVTGNLYGDIIGSINSDITGNLVGDVTGNLVGDVTGNLDGNVTGNLVGDVTGNLVGDVTGNLVGDVTGNLNGNVTGNLYGDVTGNLNGDVTGNLYGNIIGSINSDVTGNLYGDVKGSNLRLSSGGSIQFYNLTETGYASIIFNESENKLQLQRGLIPSLDKYWSIGNSSYRVDTVYSENFIGDLVGNFTGSIIGDTDVYGNITIHSYMSLLDLYIDNNIYGNNINNLVTINDNLTVNNDLIVSGNSSFLNYMDLNDNKIINVNKINDRYLINETIETTSDIITFTVNYSNFTDDFVDYHLHITCLEDNNGTYETTTYFYETKGYYQSDSTYTEDNNNRSGSHISISSKTWDGSSYIIEIDHHPDITMYKWNISGEITTKQTINNFSITV